jgi:hypothetical protein
MPPRAETAPTLDKLTITLAGAETQGLSLVDPTHAPAEHQITNPEANFACSEFHAEVQAIINTIARKADVINQFVDAKRYGPRTPNDVNLLHSGIENILEDIVESAGILAEKQDIAAAEQVKHDKAQAPINERDSLIARRTKMLDNNQRSSDRRHNSVDEADHEKRVVLVAKNQALAETTDRAMWTRKDYTHYLSNFTNSTNWVRRNFQHVQTLIQNGPALGASDAESIHNAAYHASLKDMAAYITDGHSPLAVAKAGENAYLAEFDNQLTKLRRVLAQEFKTLNDATSEKHAVITSKVDTVTAKLTQSIDTDIAEKEREIQDTDYDRGLLGIFPLDKNPYKLKYIRNPVSTLEAIRPFTAGKETAQAYIEHLRYQVGFAAVPDADMRSRIRILKTVPPLADSKEVPVEQESAPVIVLPPSVEVTPVTTPAPLDITELGQPRKFSRRKFLVGGLGAVVASGLALKYAVTSEKTTEAAPTILETAAWGAPESITMWKSQFDRLATDARSIELVVTTKGDNPVKVDLISKYPKYLQSLMIVTTYGDPEGPQAPIFMPADAYTNLRDTVLNLDPKASGQELYYNNLLIAARYGNRIIGSILQSDPSMLAGYNDFNGTLASTIAGSLFEKWNPSVDWVKGTDKVMADARNNFVTLCKTWGNKNYTAFNDLLASDDTLKTSYDSAATKGHAAGLSA